MAKSYAQQITQSTLSGVERITKEASAHGDHVDIREIYEGLGDALLTAFFTQPGPNAGEIEPFAEAVKKMLVSAKATAESAH
jgi:hypothetical protein